MKRFLVLSAFIAAPAFCQTDIPSPVKPSPPPISTLSSGAQLVIVDVTVTDKSGKPIHGLKQEDFRLTESHAAQTPKVFEEHSAIDRSNTPPPRVPRLPPGTFTDFQPVAEDAPLNVLLLDALNTPMTDQAYVRYELQQYVKKAQPGTRIAIFGLTTHLILLQGFSSDPEVLKNVVEHKLLPRSSVLLDDPAGTGVMSDSVSDQMASIGASSEAVANMAQFEAETSSYQTQLRTTYTLEAFAALARYLASFPGRKNLLWFSGAFPLTIFPDSSLEDPFSVQADSSGALRDTSTALDRARVAVYPIDARGLQTNPIFSAANGTHYGGNPAKFSNAVSNWSQNNAQEHMAMDQIAEDTGGHAFYNNNDLAAAVTKSLAAGSNFYTLAYAPTNRKYDGGYRSIRVDLQGAAAANGYRLSYRHGYYALDPGAARKAAPVSTADTGTPPAIPSATPPSTAFHHTALERGAPTPSEILFKVRVLPVSTDTEDAVAPHNEPNPDGRLKGPFRRFNVDFATLASDVRFNITPDKVRHGRIEFIAFVYDRNGLLLNADGSTINMELQPATYATLLRGGLNFRQQISVPAKGDTFLRIAVHDLTSDRYGVVELPTDSVSHLAPVPDPKPVVNTPTAPTTATPPAAAPPPAAAVPKP